MSCPSEERLALHACGDALDPAIEAHLAACPACRALASAFQDDAGLLDVELAVPESALVAVSRAVSARTRPARSRAWVWGVAAAAALLLVVWLRPSTERQPPPTVAEVRPNLHPPVVTEQPPVPRSPVLRRSRPVARPKPRREPVEQPANDITVVPQRDGALVIAKRTADPNVVILLVAEPEPSPGDLNAK